MKEHSLKNPTYISIPDSGSFSYGGNQQWFGKDARLSRYGCGNIALSDLCLYLTRRCRLATPETLLAESAGRPLTRASYLEYARLMNRRYTFTLPFCGCTGVSLTLSLNHFFLRRRLPFRARYLWLNTGQGMLFAIEDSLLKDIPVLLAIGPNFPNFRGRRGVMFYTRDEQRWTRSVSPSYVQKKAPGSAEAFLPSANSHVHAHFVTITGLFYPSPSRPMLSVSSWGRQYFISYRELRAYIRKYGLSLTSSLICIHPTGASHS